MGLFLEAQGHPLPQHTQVKSASSLSRFFNHYEWSTRGVIRATRKATLQQIEQHRPPRGSLEKVLIDLTTLEKCGKFLHLSNVTDDPEAPDPWVRVLNGKRGLHIVVLYLVIGQWRVPWSFRIWRGLWVFQCAPVSVQIAGNRSHYSNAPLFGRCLGRYRVWHR
ncbi:MAG: hypothetical protein ACRCZS_21655 [Chroococcidiopsis sp.]